MDYEQAAMETVKNLATNKDPIGSVRLAAVANTLAQLHVAQCIREQTDAIRDQTASREVQFDLMMGFSELDDVQSSETVVDDDVVTEPFTEEPSGSSDTQPE